MTTKMQILHGDSRVLLDGLEENSVDAVVCDPPYGLTPDGRSRTWDDVDQVRGGFMGKEWDAAVPGVTFWRQVLRILKPGGYLVSFAGARTYHRMAVAVEDAGFEVRDMLEWLYGSGMPHGMDVALAMSKAERGFRQGGVDPTSPNHGKYKGGISNGRVTGSGFGAPGQYMKEAGVADTRGYTTSASPWAGWNSSLKPSHEPIILARKTLSEKTLVDNILRWGTGAINVDASRIDGVPWKAHKATGLASTKFFTVGEAKVIDKVPHNLGRYPSNLLLSHSPFCHPVGTKKVKARVINRFDDGAKPFGHGAGHPYTTESMGDEHGEETLGVWQCSLDCPVALLDQQSGDRKAGGKVKGTEPSHTGQNGVYGTYGRVENQPYEDSGGASRFFNVLEWEDAEIEGFLYSAKAAGKERNAGLADRNPHATVKPIRLMEWLIQLVTQPGGVILDPFLGSGTTGCAATRLGFNFIGIEQDQEYVEIAQQRIAYWSTMQKENR